MKIASLRLKISTRTKELGIEPAHDSTGHWYRFNGNLYPSVTAKLSIIKDQGLMNWKMNRALEDIETRLELGWINSGGNIDKLIAQAKLAPQQEFEGAGDIGSTVHAWRERWFTNWIETGDNGLSQPPIDSRPEVLASCEAIKRCVEDLQAEPLACELRLADEKLKLGGSLDDIWRVGEENWLIDLKTSNIGNKDSYYLQVATYWKMFRRLYKIKIDRLFILHTSKTRFGEYELIELKNPKRYWQMARNVFRLYDDLEELKELKKPIGVKI